MVIDLDVEELQIRQASVSDDQGHLKRFDLVSSVRDNNLAGSSMKSDEGPRKTVGPTKTRSGGPVKFMWGVQAGENKQPEAAKSDAAGPIRVERFELRRIQPQPAAN